MDRVARLVITCLMASLFMAQSSSADLANEAAQVAVIPPGSSVFFGNFLSTLPDSEQSAAYRIRAWQTGESRHAVISEEVFYSLTQRRFDEAHGSEVTLTVADDFMSSTVHAQFAEVGRVTLTFYTTNGPARTFNERCNVVGQDWYEVDSPSFYLASSFDLRSRGSIDGRPTLGTHPCRTYGIDAVGAFFLAGLSS